ncbi:2530_t:CDS:10, partial [Gigaspora margarita]
PENLPTILQNPDIVTLILKYLKGKDTDDEMPALLFDWNQVGFNDKPNVPNCRNDGHAIGTWHSNVAVNLPWARHQTGVPNVCNHLLRLNKITASTGRTNQSEFINQKKTQISSQRSQRYYESRVFNSVKKMVYYFTSTVVDPPAIIYMGKDKEENEDLIKHGWEEDVCAHVYLRLQVDQSWETIPTSLLNDLGQLVKANSIAGSGSKEKSVMVVYTPWSNLLKTAGMATGEVSFHDHSKVKKLQVGKKDNSIIRRLEKTKTENIAPDLAGEKLAMEKEKRRLAREAANAKKQEELRLEQERRDKAAKNSYDSIFVESNMRSNQNVGGEEVDLEEDFM